MMQHIYQKGPIAWGVAVPSDFYSNYTGGIYRDTTGSKHITHIISIVGYGVENGTKYWVGRNSWGETWGEGGFFRLVRGENNIAVESSWAFAEVIDTWTQGITHNTTDAERKDPSNDYSNGPYPGQAILAKVEHKGCSVKNEWYGDEETNVPQDIQNLKESDLPESVDWRNYNGTNYVSWSKNQHIPIYWGSCWSQGTTSALSDRFNILNWLKNNNTNAPQVSLSAQTIVNCEAGGSCNGGQPASVYRFAYKNGIPHESCQQYIARNIEKKQRCLFWFQRLQRLQRTSSC